MSKALAGGFAVVAVISLSLAVALPRTSATSLTKPHARPSLLAVLPEIGSVFTRANCSRAGHPGRSIGIRQDRLGQSGQVAFRTGRLTGWRDLEPGSPTVWLPCVTHGVESLAVDAGGENGFVIATARVDFGHRPEAYGHDPPRLTLQLYPRGYYKLGGSFFRKNGRLKLPRS